MELGSNYAVKLTLWGPRASEFDGDRIYELSQTETVVILFVGVLMKRYGYEEGLTGNAACRWYVCPNVAEATALKNSIHANFEPISRIVLRDQIPQATIVTGSAEEKTIQEILEINPYDFPPTGVRCTVTIAKLSPGQSWWFFSCNKCSRKSVPDGTAYKCSACLCRTAKPRYKLCVIGTDGTANAEFMLFGDIGQQVVGKQQTTPPPQQICSSKPEQQQSNKEPYGTLGSTRKRLFDTQSASTQHTQAEPSSKKKTLVVDEIDHPGFVHTKLQSMPEQQTAEDISTCTNVSRQPKIYQLVLMSHRRVLPVKSANNFGCACQRRAYHRSCVLLPRSTFIL